MKRVETRSRAKNGTSPKAGSSEEPVRFRANTGRKIIKVCHLFDMRHSNIFRRE